MAGKFEIYKDKAGEFRFRLKAGNGQTILASEGYTAHSGCANGIASLKKTGRMMHDMSIKRPRAASTGLISNQATTRSSARANLMNRNRPGITA